MFIIERRVCGVSQPRGEHIAEKNARRVAGRKKNWVRGKKRRPREECRGIWEEACIINCKGEPRGGWGRNGLEMKTRVLCDCWIHYARARCSAARRAVAGGGNKRARVSQVERDGLESDARLFSTCVLTPTDICPNLPKSETKPEIWFWKFFNEHTYQTYFFSLFVVYI